MPGKEGPGVEDALGVRAQVSDRYGGQAQELQLSRDQPHGLVAVGSNRRQKDAVRPRLYDPVGNLPRTRLFELPDIQ